MNNEELKEQIEIYKNERDTYKRLAKSLIKQNNKLEDRNEVLKSALLFIFRDYKVEEIDIEELKNVLNELKNSNWGDE